MCISALCIIIPGGNFYMPNFMASENGLSGIFSAENAYVWIAAAGVFTVLLVGIILIFMIKLRRHQDIDPVTGGKNKNRFFMNVQSL